MKFEPLCQLRGKIIHQFRQSICGPHTDNMGDVLAAISLGGQAIPLIVSGCKSLHLICSHSKRREMRQDYLLLEDLCIRIYDSMQMLEYNTRRQFKRRTRQAFKALKWLSALVRESAPGQSKRRKWKLRVRQAIIYLFGQNTLKCALEQMESLWDALRRGEDMFVPAHKRRSCENIQILNRSRNRILSIMRESESRYRGLVRTFRRLERRVRRSLNSTIATPTNHPAEGLATPLDPSTILEDNQNGAHCDSIDHADMGSTSAASNEEVQGQRVYEPNPVDSGDEEYLYPLSEVEDTNLDPDTMSVDSRDAPPSDEGTDEDEISNTTTISSSYNEMETLSTLSIHGSGFDGVPSVSTEDAPKPTSGFSPNDDDTPSDTGNDGTNSQPDAEACAHQDVSIHAWNWSLIIYASNGIRIKCRACGEQRAESEFSSLLEKSEEGGAKLNWKHISNIRWWPGAAYSWC